VVADQGGKRSIVDHILKIGEGMAGRVVQTEKPLIVNDYGTWPGRASVYEKDLFRAVVAVPLIWEERILGVLYVTDDKKRRVFKERDAYVLSLLASQAAIAMLEETRRRAHELERKAKHLNLINQIAATVNSRLDLGEILQIAVSEMAKVFAMKQSGVVIFDHQSRYGWVLAEYQQVKDSTAKEVKIPIAGNPTMEWILTYKQPLAIEDAQNDPLTIGIRNVVELRRIKSILIVPLVVNEEIYGTIGLDALDEPRVFTKEEIELAQTIANQIAIAIGNARLFEATDRNLKQLEAVDWISKLIGVAPTLDGILQVTLEEGLRTIGIDEGSIMLIDPITNELEIKAWLVRGSFVDNKSHRKLGLGEGIAGHVVTTGEAYNCANTELDPYFVASFTGRKPRSLLCVPIIAQGRVLGTINADSKHLSFFKEDNVRFLAALSSHVAIAVESHRLKEIGIALSTVKLDALLTRIVESASMLTGAEFSTLFLVDELSGNLKRAKNFPPSKQTTGGPRQDGLSYRMMTSGKPIIVQDAQRDPLVKQASKDQGIKSMMGVPLKVRVGHENTSIFRIIGILWVNTRQQREFSDRDVKLLESLASQAAVAIENARLFEETRRRALALETLHETSLHITNYQSLPILADLILERAVQLLQARGGSLFLLNEYSERVEVVAVLNLPKHLKSLSLPVGKGVVGNVIKTRVPIYIPNYQEWEYRLPQFEVYGFTAVVGAPIIWQDKILGAISIHDDIEGRTFEQEDLNILAYLGNLAAVVLENARRMGELDEIRQACEEISSSLSSQDVMRQIVRRTTDLIGPGTTASINVYDPKRETLLPQEVFGPRREKILINLPRKNGLAWTAYHENRPIAIKNTTNNPQVQRSARQDGVKSVVVLPVIGHHEAAVGVLYIDSILNPDIGNRLPTLQILANQAGIAIENAQLFARVRRRVEEMESLHEIGRMLSATLILPDVLKGIVENTLVLLRAKDVHLYLYHNEQNQLEFAASFWNTGEFNLQAASPRPNGLTYTVARSGKRLVVNDAATHPLFKREYSDWKVTAIAGFPLKVNNRVVGVLNVALGEESGRRFEEQEIDVLEVIASQAAIALVNAQLFEATSRQVEELRQLERAGEILASRVRVEDVLEAIVQNVPSSVYIEGVFVCLYNLMTKQFDVERAVSTGLGEGLIVWTNKKVRPGGIIQDILLHGVVFVEDVLDPLETKRIGRKAQQQLIAANIRAFVGLRLHAGDGTMGVLFINYSQPYSRTKRQDEVAILKIYTDQAASAVERARLFARQKQRQELIQSVAQTISALEDLEATWKAILQGAVALTDAEWGNISKLDEYSGFVRDIVRIGAPDEYEPVELVIGRQGIQGWVAAYKQPALVLNVLTDEKWKDIYYSDNPRTVSELTVPIKWGSTDELVGIINLESSREGAFDEDDLRLLESLAVHAGIAIQNVQLFAAVRSHAKQLREVLTAGQHITALRPITDVLQSIVDSLRVNFGYDVVILFPYRVEKESFEAPVASGHLYFPDMVISKVTEDAKVRQQLSGPEFYFTPDASYDELLAGSFTDREQVQASGYVHLTIGGEVVGILFVNHRRPHEFNIDEQNAVRLFANQAAIAIHNSRQFETQQRRLDQIERRGKHLLALHESIKAIIVSLDRRTTLQAILEEAAKLTGANFATIQEKRGDKLYFEAVYPEKAKAKLFEQVGEYMSITGPGITVQVANTEKPYLTNNVQEIPGLFVNGSGNTTGSELAVPLFVDKHTWGVLNVEHPQTGAFTVDDLFTLEALGNLAILALQNAERADRLSRANTVAIMGAWGADILHDVTREVGAIRRSVYVLQQNAHLPHGIRDELQNIDHYAEMLDLPQLPEQPMELNQMLASIDSPWLDRVIEDELDILRRTHQSVTLRSDLRCSGIKVSIHKQWLRRLLRHFIYNAVKATREKKDRIVMIRTEIEGSMVDTQVEDTGEGIRPEIESLLFDRPIVHQGREGRGLLLVRFLVEQHGGNARLVWNRLGEGACFAFRIPIAQVESNLKVDHYL
jgi:GAF domain-containing protein